MRWGCNNTPTNSPSGKWRSQEYWHALHRCLWWFYSICKPTHETRSPCYWPKCRPACRSDGLAVQNTQSYFDYEGALCLWTSSDTYVCCILFALQIGVSNAQQRSLSSIIWRNSCTAEHACMRTPASCGISRSGGRQGDIKCHRTPRWTSCSHSHMHTC